MKAFKKLVNASNDVAKMIDENSPVVLTCAGIIGMGVAMLLMYKATKEATHILDEESYEEEIEQLKVIEDEDISDKECTDICKSISIEYKKEAAKLIIPMFMPVIVIFGASTYCLVKSCSISSKRLAAAVTSYTLLETAYTEYRNKVKETIGVKKEEKVRDDILKDKVDNTPVPEGIVCLDGEVLFYDKYRDGYFNARPDDVLNAIAECNNTIFNHGMGFVSLRDLYVEIEPRLAKDALTNVGWNSMNPLMVRVSYQVAPNMMTCWCLDYLNEPRSDYDKWR